MKFLCLCPTYGRPQHLIENILHCFLTQTHKDKFLLIYDDLGTLPEVNEEQYKIVSSALRIPSLPEKYHVMLNLMEQSDILWDAVALMDDDDVYLPRYLEFHNEALLERNGWSHPKEVWTTYADSGVAASPWLDPAHGRFHGSLAMTQEFLDRVGGWVQTSRATFDQEFIARLAKRQSSADPCLCGPPQYVFRWNDTGAKHAQHYMTNENGDRWYESLVPSSAKEMGRLTPQYDVNASQVVDYLS